MYIAFNLDQENCPKVSCLFERNGSECWSQDEEEFMEKSNGFREWPDSYPFSSIVKELLDDSSDEFIVVSRNENLILDKELKIRLERAFNGLRSFDDQWVIASSGGLGVKGHVYCSLYSSKHPAIFEHFNTQPIVDTMLDLYVLHAANSRKLIGAELLGRDVSFELSLITIGYTKGCYSVYMSALSAGVYGAFRGRDSAVLAEELEHVFGQEGEECEMDTLLGKIVVASDEGQTGSQMRRGNNTERSMKLVLDRLVSAPRISIVTRTQFRRPYLLERLLTSISRARINDIELEVVLSTDCDAAEVVDYLQGLEDRFRGTKIRVHYNPKEGHSRVTNLFGGIDAAEGEYVWIIDDDDYLDVLALERIKHVFLFGNRPLIISSADVLKEQWEEIDGGRHVLAGREPKNTFRAGNWKRMFSGVNQNPICSFIMPRKFVQQCVKNFDFRHDLSEDYALYLLLLTSPLLPEIVEVDEVLTHISDRDEGDNVVNLVDRSPWVRDIMGYLFDIARKGTLSPGQASLLKNSSQFGSDVVCRSVVDDLRGEIEKKDAEIRNLSTQVEALRQIKHS